VADKAVTKKPAAEDKTAEDTDRQVSETAEPTEAVESTEAESEAPGKAVKTPEEAEGESPETAEEKMTPEQARAFQAQRLEIKRLKEEMAKKEKAGSAFEALKPKAGQVGIDQPPKVESFMDAEGRIDIAGYQDATQKYQQTQALRSQAEQRRLKQEVEENFLKMKDPRLDPDNRKEYDEAFEGRVADRWSRMALEALYQGKPEPSVKAAYDSVVQEGVSPKEKEQISKEALERVSEKEQAASTAEAPSTTPRAQGAKMVANFDELRYKTKLGDNDALAARIQKAEE
jgi:hypothetical protein